jgi:hypothetical protein
LQHQRLVEQAAAAGSAVPALLPSPAEAATARQQVNGGPAVVLAALRQARAMIDVADATLAAGTPGPSLSLRPLLVYGPIAGILLVVQLFLSLVFDPRGGSLLVLVPCDASMAVLGWATGWLLVKPILRTRDRGAALGALVCAVPVVLSLAGFVIIH